MNIDRRPADSIETVCEQKKMLEIHIYTGQKGNKKVFVRRLLDEVCTCKLLILRSVLSAQVNKILSYYVLCMYNYYYDAPHFLTMP